MKNGYPVKNESGFSIISKNVVLFKLLEKNDREINNTIKFCIVFVFSTHVLLPITQNLFFLFINIDQKNAKGKINKVTVKMKLKSNAFPTMTTKVKKTTRATAKWTVYLINSRSEERRVG